MIDYKLRRLNFAQRVYASVFGYYGLLRSDKDGYVLSFERELMPSFLEEDVEEALTFLPPRECEVVRRRLEQEQTFKEIAKDLSISDSRPPQIFHRALRRLREAPTERILTGAKRQADWEREQTAETTLREQEILDIMRQQCEAKQREEARLNAERTEEAKKTPTDELFLREQTRNLLRENEILTVGALLERFPFDEQTNKLTGLEQLEGITRISYQEIWRCLYLIGALVRPIREPENLDLIVTEANEDRIKLCELGLSLRAYNALFRYGYRYADELTTLFRENGEEEAPEKLRQVRNLGRKSLLEVVSMLREKGWI